MARRFFPYALQRGDIAGAVVVVVKDGNILLQKGYGFAAVAARKPVDPERTLFRAGSVSKLFTWTAVMQQVERGKLDLDADVNTYLACETVERRPGGFLSGSALLRLRVSSSRVHRELLKPVPSRKIP